MEKIIWVIGDDRLEMIEAQRRINAAGSMRALCLLSFEAVQKAALAQEEGERSRISTPSLIIFDYQMAKKEDFASVLFLRRQQSLGGVPLFFMTEKRSEELDEECYEKGATVVVHKPFSASGYHAYRANGVAARGNEKLRDHVAKTGRRSAGGKRDHSA